MTSPKSHEDKQLSNSDKDAVSEQQCSDNLPLDLIPDPFIILRSDSTVLDANLSFFRLIGSEKEAVINKTRNEIPLLRDLSRKISLSFSSGSEDFERIAFHNKHFEVLTLPFRLTDESYLIRIVLKDITNFIRLEKELMKRNKELIIVNTLSSTFISSENMDMVMEDLIDKILLITDFHTGFLLMNEDDNLKLRTSKGISPDLQNFITAGGIQPLCDDALKIHEPMYIIERPAISKISVLREEGFVFIVAIPLLSNQKVMGLLFLASRVNREMDFDFAALLSLIGNHVSHIIDKIKLFQERENLIKLERELAFRAAHKIGNPIYAIETELITMRRRIEKGNLNILDIIEALHVSVEKTKNIIEDLKSLTRAESVNFQKTDIMPIIRHSLRIAEQKGVSVEVKPPMNVLYVIADPNRMTECFDELIANSLKWFDKQINRITVVIDLPDNKQIPSKLDKNSSFLRILLSDNGPGIPLEKKDVIFNPFFTTDTEGSGLGLAVVKRSIESSIGFIQEIGKYGEGATFEIWLPLSQKDE